MAEHSNTPIDKDRGKDNDFQLVDPNPVDTVLPRMFNPLLTTIQDVVQEMTPKPAPKVAEKSEPSQTWDMGQMGHLQFTDELYNSLPTLLRDCCNVLTTNTEKEVFLVGAIGVISGILPNFLGHYDGRYIEPNLFCYILAPYGSGKGGLEYARQLGAAVHTSKRVEYERATEFYEQEKQQYEKDKKAFARSKTSTAEAPKVPTPPPNWMLFVPANSSKTGLYQVLAENGGRLIIFETEGDTLADALKADYANFSDGLRKAFHHESISYFRRANGGEYVEVKKPCLSVILSSTFDQLKSLMPSAENGLFSRFLFYELTPTSEFRNVFDKRKQDYSAHFESAGLEMQRIYDTLISLSQPVYFDLTSTQQSQFLKRFQGWKDQSREDVGVDLDGTVNRLGVICFRIAMLFSALRAFEQPNTPQSITCSELDFENAVTVIQSLRGHALSVWSRLPTSSTLADDEQAATLKITQMRQCRELYKRGMSVREISKQVFGTENKKSTVNRWVLSG